MPYKRKYRKRRRKKKRTANYKLNKAMGLTPLPRRFKTTMRYVETVALNPPTAALATYIFSANGVFDPNITGGGHQPRGWDQIIPMYDHATVIGSKILIQCASRDTGNGITCGVALRDSPTAEVGLADYVEQGNCAYKNVAAVGGPVTQVNYGVAPKKFLGLNAMDDLLRNTVSSNPSEQCYWHVFAGNSGGVDTGIVDVLVTIEYIMVFTEPKDLLAS